MIHQILGFSCGSYCGKPSKALDEVAMAEAPTGKELIPSTDGQGITWLNAKRY